MTKTNKNYRIGTSGWHYKHWTGPFYPEKMKTGDMLKFYLQHFSTVEINNSFYKLPEEKTLKQWASLVPAGFEFAVKASRYITHVKKLKDPEEPVNTFMSRIEVLGDKLGPVLFQLPPSWKVNLERLESFCKVLPGGFSYAFEFRNPTWFDDSVIEILNEYNASFCIYDIEGRTSPSHLVGPIRYIRLHGPDGKYQGSYSKQQLRKWANLLSSWREQGRKAYCYFDNDQNGYAPHNALTLMEMLQTTRSS
ncbi:MAG: DUF72 domain-containing protein [Chitinivibrionales bacterium]|nr:DUF72 domain-containing protein [Chitinivibrionales bacterium]